MNIIEIVATYYIDVLLVLITTSVLRLYTSGKAVGTGMQALMRYSIVNAYNHAQERGGVTLYERESLLKMHDAYCALGGNGITKSLIEEITKLPIKHDD